jgi:hypothetical protein
MEEWTALIEAVAALLGAVAWPLSIFFVFVLFRKSIPRLLDRIQMLKQGDTEIHLVKIEAELEKRADSVGGNNKVGERISAEEIVSAAKIDVQARSLNNSSLRDHVRQLCVEYETLRKTMKAGPERTRGMTQTFVKMRALGRAVSQLLDEMKVSSSAGHRLFAVAVMQMNPDKIDLGWLLRRFQEDMPFVFFHAANAIRIASESADAKVAADARSTAQAALRAVESFSGPKDENTVRVLTSVLGQVN